MRALTIADAVRDIVTALGQWARERSLINQKEYSGAELTSPEITHPARPGVFPVRRFPSPWASAAGESRPGVSAQVTRCPNTLRPQNRRQTPQRYPRIPHGSFLNFQT